MPSYAAMRDRFEAQHTHVLGISVDHSYSHQAWAKQLNITYPLLCDFYPHGQVSAAYGVLRDDPQQGAYGACERAIFVLDKQGVIRFIKVMPILEIPDPEEIFGVLSTLPE